MDVIGHYLRLLCIKPKAIPSTFHLPSVQEFLRSLHVGQTTGRCHLRRLGLLLFSTRRPWCDCKAEFLLPPADGLAQCVVQSHNKEEWSKIVSLLDPCQDFQLLAGAIWVHHLGSCALYIACVAHSSFGGPRKPLGFSALCIC